MTNEELQLQAEHSLFTQLSFLGGYEVASLEKEGALDPEMEVRLRDGQRVLLYVRAFEGGAAAAPPSPEWEEARRRHAEREGFVPFFVDVTLSPQGGGFRLEYRGLWRLTEALQALGRGVPLEEWVRTPVNRMEDEEILAMQSEQRMKKMLTVVAGKPIDVIPDSSYCYTLGMQKEKQEEFEECERLHGPNSTEAWRIFLENFYETPCPYQEYTDHGTVRCNYLEMESVVMNRDAHEKALAYFGSPEVMAEVCNGDEILGDSVQCCRNVVARVRAAASLSAAADSPGGAARDEAETGRGKR